jgi:hypothetical protein
MSATKEDSRSEPESERLQQSLAFLHQARDVRGLQPTQVERIERRLRGHSHRAQALVLVPVVATLGLLVVAGAAFAVAKGGLRSLPIVGPLFSPAASTGDSKSEEHRRPALPKSTVEKAAAPATSALAPAPIQPAPLPGVEPTRAVAQDPEKAAEPAARAVRVAGLHPRTLALRDPEASHQPARFAAAPEAPAPPPVGKEENPIVAESRSFASVLEPWHRTRNPGTALALLDAHERRYPSGHMRLESHILRAEIYLAQGREDEVLKVLDALALSGIPRGRELQTVRGELRIKAGRCADGKRDLGEVLEKSMSDALGKRAAQSFAHCP